MVKFSQIAPLRFNLGLADFEKGKLAENVVSNNFDVLKTMTNNATPTGYLGSISESNKRLFPKAIQEAFDFIEANSDAEFFASKNHAAQLQFDKNIARQALQKLDAASSLKEALAAVLANLPNDRNDKYVRGFVQWFITEFETSFVEAKDFAG